MKTANQPFKIDPDALIAVIDAGLVNQPSPSEPVVIQQETPEQAERRQLREHLIWIWPSDQCRPQELRMSLHQLLADELARRTKKDVVLIKLIPEEKLRDIFKRSVSTVQIRNDFNGSAGLSICGMISLGIASPLYAPQSLGWFAALAACGTLMFGMALYGLQRCYHNVSQNRQLGREIEGQIEAQMRAVPGPKLG